VKSGPIQPERSVPATLLLVLDLTNNVVIHEDQLITRPDLPHRQHDLSSRMVLFQEWPIAHFGLSLLRVGSPHPESLPFGKVSRERMHEYQNATDSSTILETQSAGNIRLNATLLGQEGSRSQPGYNRPQGECA
jgi:hypothetical protein